MTDRSIVFVHAHPDDECLTTGGTIARYASEGTRVTLVTCTNGELGEVAEVPDLGTAEEITERLGEIRLNELALAAKALNVSDLFTLGYRDSGMAGAEGNHDQTSFVNQDLNEVVSRIAEIYRTVRPQVVVTYNEFGGYGHPDHIRTHEGAVLAIEAAADPDFAIDGQPHRVGKLYYTALSRAAMYVIRDRFAEAGDTEALEFFSDENLERITTPDEQITAVLDIRPWLREKFESILAHRTQLGTTKRWLDFNDEMRAVLFGDERFLRVRPSGGQAAEEDDLFAGIAT